MSKHTERTRLAGWTAFFILLMALPALPLGPQGPFDHFDPPAIPLRQILGLTYPDGVEIATLLKGTRRLPGASGIARVERGKGRTKIDVRLSHLKPAAWFGGDYSTYVVWVVGPEGQVVNAGEVVTEGAGGTLTNLSTPLETFALFVSAEPHFLVDTPSRFIVLQSSRPERQIERVRFSLLPYRGFDGIYQSRRESLAGVGPDVRGEPRPSVRAAVTSVDLARRAGAERHVPDQLVAAVKALERTLEAADSGVSGETLMILSRETVRRAVAAQNAARSAAQGIRLEAQRSEEPAHGENRQ